MSVSNSLTRLIHAIACLEKAKETCEYDQDYFLHREFSEVEEAECDFIVSLKMELGISDSNNP